MKAASLILVKDVSQGMICVCVQQEGISLVTSSLQNIQLAVSDFCFCGIILHGGLPTQPFITLSMKRTILSAACCIEIFDP
jgi:hypothetical protein